MPRRKISEYRSKNIVNELLGLEYSGWSVLDENIPSDISGERFVVKVDQAIKQRFKRGLIFLDVTKKDIPSRVKELTEKGFHSVLVEPYVQHDGASERYISFRREREGVVLGFSSKGGVDIEANADSIESDYYDNFNLSEVAEKTGLREEQIDTLRRTFDDSYMSLLEINPYIVLKNGQVRILDVAIEVDSSAEQLVRNWDNSDVRTPVATLTPEELVVRKMDSESPASFNLEVINPDGAIFLLLSGGGASVVIADEIFTLGYGDQLANYGEYSGNPNEYETETYATQVLSLLVKSKAKKKVVLIGGAVANFTDIKATFKGIISALRAKETLLRKQGVKFYVRRGGPRQQQGLKLIDAELQRLGLYGGVYNPSVSIPEAVANLVSEVKKK